MLRWLLSVLILAATLSAPDASTAPATSKLPVPASGEILVAFVVTDGANVMDIAGPWEVFQDTHIPSTSFLPLGDEMPFRLIVVSDRKAPIRLTGGMTLVPDYTFDDAPAPDVVVVGAQRGADKLVPWLRARHAKGSVIVSICTGAFKLAATGLLDGKRATTHHQFTRDFATKFPKVTLVAGNRFVQSDARIFTAGGLTSGIDLALHIVSLYFGQDVAAKTATYMEYSGTGWRRPEGASPVAR
jgi:transcriptional regulator GlxA family with amidase domain